MRPPLAPLTEARAHMRATLAHLAAERRWLDYLHVLDRYQALGRDHADQAVRQVR